MLPPKLILLFCIFWSSANCGVINTDTARKCQTNPTQTVNAMLDLPSVDTSLPSGTRGNVAKELKDVLQERTSVAQAPIINGLRVINPDLDVQQFWIANRIAVKDVPCALLPAIAAIPQTFTVRTEKVMDVTMLMDSIVVYGKDDNKKPDGNPQWGVDKINAPKVWPNLNGRGEGVIVANIDTGVRGTHECLINNYRGDEEFGWLNGVTNSSDESPNDGMGHGSHVMGSICGGKGIGVAPGAKWMACKGCTDDGKCVETGLLTCGEWIACPYDTRGEGRLDCEKHPDVVANSWGSLIGSDTFYNPVIEMWRKAGIIPVFAIGNTGPVCGTTGSPGNQDGVISVGATDKDDKLARFSSKGPPPPGGNSTTKPEVAAPGKDIFSSWQKADDSYSTISGTSMACPHAAGAVALLLSKSKAASYHQIEKVLQETAYKPKGLGFWDTCGSSQWPNNAFGHGRIDIAAAYEKLPTLEAP